MTALCDQNGPSGLISGYQALQQMSPDALVEFFLGADVAWFAAFAYGAGYLAFDFGNICTADPPPLPTIDAARLQSYVSSTQGAQFLRQDAIQMATHFLWFTYCHCLSGAQPAPPVAPTAPPGQQTDNPNINKVPPGACQQGPQIFAAVGLDATGNGAQVPIGGAVNAAAHWYSIPIALWQGSTTSTPLTYAVDVTIEEHSASALLATHVVQYPVQPVTPNFMVVSFPLALGTTSFNVRFHATAGANQSLEVSMIWSQFCSDMPPALRQDCCPPDPNLMILINQVLQLEQQILASLGGNFSYVRGRTHTGLTGTGTLAVTGLRGISIDIHPGGPTEPILPGNPVYNFNQGWVSISDANGMLQEQRITRTHQVFLPMVAELGTTVGYYANPGVTIDITELIPA